jgi:formate-nitrite transporter family protein
VRPELGHLVGALAFGIGFVFVVVGRSELFTENFLVPVAGLDRRSRASWLKLGELWVGTLIALGTFNHAIVSTIELVFGMRYGAAVSVGDLFRNLGLAVGGNLVGGLLLVTFARSAQAVGATSS